MYWSINSTKGMAERPGVKVTNLLGDFLDDTRGFKIWYPIHLCQGATTCSRV